MRRFHVFIAVLLCGLLAAGPGLRVPVGAGIAAAAPTGAGLRAGYAQPLKHGGKLSAAHLVLRGGPWQQQRVAAHPDLFPPAPAPATRRAAAPLPVAQTDRAARAYLRHLHPSHDFP